ncbi:DUF368 domain-containing protein [Planctomicrobium sp. SH661]|uniref:DUF368 domain-containing protein n=1 Tax=Planctomicrobium sp. SH661 TaxID=3448124 RepID=UPI003F5B315B
MSETPVTTTPAEELPARPFAFFGCGVLMGTCNVIPGGDSGTIALIMGIYQRIVTAISRADGVFAMQLLKGQWKQALNRVDIWFMLPLVAGVGFGIASMGSFMHYMLEHHFEIMMPIFFGLIAASCWLVAKLIERWGVAEILLLVGGTALALWMVRQPGLAHPPDQLWYIVLCGFIGICALILPGISGAFLLIILGKYHDLTGVIDRATKFNLTGDDFSVLVAFGVGCALGLVSCSKFLKWLLEHHGSATMAGLCGFKIGSLYKIWPFQIDKTPEIHEFKHKDFQPVFRDIPIDGHFWMVVLIVVGVAAAMLWLEHYALRQAKKAVHDDPV